MHYCFAPGAEVVKSLPRKTQEVWYSDSLPTGDSSLYAIQTMMA